VPTAISPRMQPSPHQSYAVHRFCASPGDGHAGWSSAVGPPSMRTATDDEGAGICVAPLRWCCDLGPRLARIRHCEFIWVHSNGWIFILQCSSTATNGPGLDHHRGRHRDTGSWGFLGREGWLGAPSPPGGEAHTVLRGGVGEVAALHGGHGGVPHGDPPAVPEVRQLRLLPPRHQHVGGRPRTVDRGGGGLNPRERNNWRGGASPQAPV